MELYSHRVQTKWGNKTIRVVHGELSQLPGRVDLLVCSAFWRDYLPTRTSLIGALARERGISVAALAETPAVNLRDLGVWISAPVADPLFGRIACVEMRHIREMRAGFTQEELRSLYDTLFFTIRKCRSMGIAIRSLAMNLLGTGNQGIELETSMTPLLTECLSALKTQEELESITFFDRRETKLLALVEALKRSVEADGATMAFISYSHKDQTAADLLADALETCGIKPWIDHRMLRNGDYAEEIVRGIRESRAFLLLVSSYSMKSPDVLREVRNASNVSDSGGLLLCPLMLEHTPLAPGIAYYLTGIDAMDLTAPPIESRIPEACRALQSRIAAR